MTTSKFETGKTYTMGFIGDSELKPEYICIKLTEKTATFKDSRGSEAFTKKINVYMDSQYVRYGYYSMAPTIYAKSLKN